MTKSCYGTCIVINHKGKMLRVFGICDSNRFGTWWLFSVAVRDLSLFVPFVHSSL